MLVDPADLPEEGAARGYADAGFAVIVVRSGGQVRAYQNRCPHRGTPLDWSPGQFLDLSGTYLQCAAHGALFRPTDGYCIAGPCVGQAPRSIPVTLASTGVRIEEGEAASVGSP